MGLTKLVEGWTGFGADKRAVTALEYALIAALVASVLIVGVTTFGTSLSGMFTNVAGTF